MMGDAAATLLPAVDTDIPSAAAPPGVVDPAAAVYSEVENGMAAMIEQHTAWLELCAAGQRGEEYDWRTAELLSSLRSIEWDLQDLEDHVSIIEGARAKFPDFEDDLLAARKQMIESVRRKIDSVRGHIQQAALTTETGAGKAQNAAGKASSAARDALQALRQGKGFVKLQEDKREGKGCFSASKPSSGNGGSGSNVLLSPTGVADGSSSGAGGGTSQSAADVEVSSNKPWFLCCC